MSIVYLCTDPRASNLALTNSHVFSAVKVVTPSRNDARTEATV